MYILASQKPCLTFGLSKKYMNDCYLLPLSQGDLAKVFNLLQSNTQ